MRVLSYLRMEIDPDQIEAYEEDLEEMIRMAGETPGFLGVEVFRARGEPNVYLVLSEWASHEGMRSFLMEERHVRLGSNIQTLTTPELMFRALLTKDGTQRLELART